MYKETKIMLTNKWDKYISIVISLIFFILAVVLFLVGTWTLPLESITGVSVISAFLFFFGMYFAGFFNDTAYFYNDKYAIKLCAKVFNFANDEICAVTGEGNSTFYENPAIKSSLLRGADRHVDTRILFGPYFDIKSITLLKLARDKKITIRRVLRRKDIHCKIVDNEYVDIADMHNPMEVERSGRVERSVTEASKHKEMFEKWWEEAEEFDIFTELQNYEKELEKLIPPKNDVDEEHKGQNKERKFGFIKGEKEDYGKIRPVPVNIKDLKILRNNIFSDKESL